VILTQDNEYAAVLDACVLIPMPLCDTLLRLAEEPAMYRPLWSDAILEEVGRVLETDLKLTPPQRDRRIKTMRDFFPEAMVPTPSDLIPAMTGIPDENDKHVLAAAIRGQANAIVTYNVKDFPPTCMEQYGILCQSPDDFLIHQFHLNPAQVLEKIDAQASAINQSRPLIITLLRVMCPGFAGLLQQWTS
jgi:predicted nucleic acid-binding protein